MSAKGSFATILFLVYVVRFGSKAEAKAFHIKVRITPESGPWAQRSKKK